MFAVCNGRIIYVRTNSLSQAHLIAYQIARSRPSIAAHVYVREVTTGLTV